MLDLLIITGSRTATADAVNLALTSYSPKRLVHGGAKGADRLAGRWAESKGIGTIVVPADWSQGKIAGHLRNWEMMRRGQAALNRGASVEVLAVWDGTSGGTANAIAAAMALGLPVVVHLFGRGCLLAQPR